MSFNTQTVLNCTLSWTQSDTSNGANSLVNDNSSVQISDTMNSGSGNSNVNLVWADSVTFTGNGPQELVDYDLNNLPREILGVSGNISFSGGNVRQIAIVNKETGITSEVYLCFSGSNAFRDTFNGENTVIPLGPEGVYVYNNPTGAEISSANHTFYAFDGGNGSNLELAIIGLI